MTIQFTKNNFKTLIIVGILCLILSMILGIFSQKIFFLSYLTSFLFYLGLSLGSLILYMISHLTASQWGKVLQPYVFISSRLIILMLLLFLPLFISFSHLYPWASPNSETLSHLVVNKLPYLNKPAFILRSFIYFASWISLSHFLGRYQRLSGPGLILITLTASFALIDWAMSLEPAWFSSIYPVILLTGFIILSLAFHIHVLQYNTKNFHFNYADKIIHDMGNLLFAFIMIWAYVSFSQFLIIWNGNRPEEVEWYLKRFSPLWIIFAFAIIVFKFFIPFFFLLQKKVKRNIQYLEKISLFIIFMFFIELIWIILPSHDVVRPNGGEILIINELNGIKIFIHLFLILLTFVGMGSLWLGFFYKKLYQYQVSGDLS